MWLLIHVVIQFNVIAVKYKKGIFCKVDISGLKDMLTKYYYSLKFVYPCYLQDRVLSKSLINIGHPHLYYWDHNHKYWYRVGT